MLTSSKTRDAFDLSKEPDRVRDRYGRNLSGSSLLVARRLVEAGVPFVSVHAEIFGTNGHSYDMHENNFGMLKDENLPILDMAYPALIQDLDERGLLDSTLVVVMGEMGRSPASTPKAGPRPLAAVRLQPADRRRRQVRYGLRRHRQARRLPHARSRFAGRRRGHDLPPARHRPAHDRARPKRPPDRHRPRRRADLR